MDTVNYTILGSNLESNSIVVRPYSTEFKHPPEQYPPVNINFTNLDPNFDVYTQIAALVQPIIQSVIAHESDKSDYTTMAAQLSTVSPIELQTISITSINALASAASNIMANNALETIGTPLSTIQFQAEFSANWNLQQTYNQMTSALTLSGVEFIV
jgi:hypothetical protein